MSAPASALYTGRLMHHRLADRPHRFQYRLYMLYLDLEELPHLDLGPLLGVERRRPLSFRRRDYLGGAGVPLAQRVREEVWRGLGIEAGGPIRLLTQVRSFGHVFNPVSFYYCFAPGGEQLLAVVAEVNNTPWNERHAYVLPGQGDRAAAVLPKSFHVSPFQPMEHHYRWRFSRPGAHLRVSMLNQAQGGVVFRSRLALERRPLTRATLLRALAMWPMMSARIVAGIYAQALRLWLKGATFHPHPPAVTAARRSVHARE